MSIVARVVLVIVAAIAGTILLGLISAQLVVGATLYGIYAYVQDQSDGRPFRHKDWNVAAGQSGSRGLEVLARPDAILPARRVQVTAILGFDEVREPGLTLPTRDQQDVHAALRAPALARAECAVIQSVFAAKCVVEAAQVSLRRDGAYAVGMKLLFTPKDGIGRVAVPDKLSYVEVPVALGGRDRRIGRSQQASARRAIYVEAASACAALRAAHGNCGLLNIRIQAIAVQGDFEVLMRSDAALGTLQKQVGG